MNKVYVLKVFILDIFVHDTSDIVNRVIFGVEQHLFYMLVIDASYAAKITRYIYYSCV